MKYRIGLDIGIASVGWAVIENDEEGKPIKIVDLGVRIFEKAENAKDGTSLASKRRKSREERRIYRRKKHRVERTKSLLIKSNILNKKEMGNLYKENSNIYELRVKALDGKISNKDLSKILLFFVKKRGYKFNNSSIIDGKMNYLASLNKKIIEEKSYRTIGEMYLKDDKFKLKDENGNFILDSKGRKILKIKNTIGEYRNIFSRELMLEEIKKILNKQKQLNNLITEEFVKKYIEIFSSQRNFEEGPGKQSPYAGNQIEKMLGNCTFEKNEKRAAKATYTFEYFKLLQEINYIKIKKIIIKENKIIKNKRELTKIERKKIIDLIKEKSNVSYYDIRKKLKLEVNERFNMLEYKNILELSEKENEEIEKNKKLNQLENYHKIKNTLDKVEKNYIKKLNEKDLDNIGYCLTIYKNYEQKRKYLKKYIKKLNETAIKQLSKLTFSGFGRLSIKAMEKIIPNLEKGLTYDKAVDKEYGDFRKSIETNEKNRKGKLKLENLEQEIYNPVVKRAIAQTIKVINAITRKFGKPDVVVIELAREIGKSFLERKKIQKRQEENRQKNEEIKKEIKKLIKINPNNEDVLKYKLWKEQNGICIYSGKEIPIKEVFTQKTIIDYIIPYNICFDNSYKNKILTLLKEKNKKKNKLPYQYIKNEKRNLKEYEVRVCKIIKTAKKRENLLKENIKKDEINKWQNRNIQDTQYISRLIYNLIESNLEFSENENFKRKVWSINGFITAHIRKMLKIEKIRTSDIHHAIDAVIIAITTQGMINKITKYYKYKNYEKISDFPEPWEKFKKELEIRTKCKTKKEIIENLKKEEIKTYKNYNNLKPIFVSRMPIRKVTGIAHLETLRRIKKENGRIKAITKTKLCDLKLKNGEIEGYLEKNKKDDKLLYDALKRQLVQYNGNGKDAFKKEFYKPRRNGSKGPLVKKVQIETNMTLGIEFEKLKAIAGNGDNIRIDVFYVKNEGYYFVPIYIIDTVKKELPNKACVSEKKYFEWKKMKEENFIFSLYKNDLVYIKRKNDIKLNSINKNENSIKTKELFAYYDKSSISSASITIRTHDNNYIQTSLGIKKLLEFKKYDVDILGNYHEVKIPEKRKKFNIKK